MQRLLASGWSRHWAVSKQMAKLAWGLLQGHDQALALKEALGTLKGPLMKIGQIAATVPDLLPASYAQHLQELQSHAPPMGWYFVQRRLIQELGPHWATHFQHFERSAQFAASLGQVHKARLTDGTFVACKIQYPHMAKAIENDLQQLALFCYAYEKYGKALRTKALQEELGQRLREEIDYIQEGRHLQWFGQVFANDPTITIPRYIAPLSTAQLLTMTWEAGHPLQEACTQPATFRNTLALWVFRAWYYPFYRYGLLHGDPHLGNFTWTPQGLNMLDFGCVRRFSPTFIEGVIMLYRALEAGQRDQRVEAYRLWGFQDLDLALIEALDLWATFLYGPLLCNRIGPIEDTFSGHRGKAVALQVHALLRQRGGVMPPHEFLLMDRVAVAIGSALIRLRAEANWYHIFNELIEGWSPTAVRQAQAALTPA